MQDFDSILESIGGFGLYQKRIYFFMCLLNIIAGFHMVISVFLTGTPKHRCALPGLVNDTYAVQNDFHLHLINQTIPPSSDDTLDYNQCEMYIGMNGLSTGSNRTLVKCNKWVYDKEVFKSTFTKEQDLVCDDKLKTSHAQMIFFGGALIGAFAIGNLSDFIGRKKSLMLSMFILFATTLSLAWAPNFVVFCIIRFLIGFGCAGMFMTAFVVAMELVAPSKRVYAGIIIQYFFSFGLLILCGIAYGLRDWKYIEIACAAPIGLTFLYWWIIPESPRWLLSKGRITEAEKIIRRAAEVNKAPYLPEKIFDSSDFEKPPTARIWDLFSAKVLLIRTLIIFFNWMSVSMCYYGLSLNSGNLGGDFYLNFLISGLVELPATTLCLVLLDRLGRKAFYIASMLIGGLTCISTIFTLLYGGESLQPLTITLAMIGKCGAAIGFNVIYVWSAELYPTVLRNTGMGASSACARIGSMTAPYIADLSKIVEGHLGKALPLVIFGGVSVIAALLSAMLPETLNQNLPETIDDAMNTRSVKNTEDKNGGAVSNPAFEEEPVYSIKATRF